jgi:hypothetical protein
MFTKVPKVKTATASTTKAVKAVKAKKVVKNEFSFSGDEYDGFQTTHGGDVDNDDDDNEDCIETPFDKSAMAQQAEANTGRYNMAYTAPTQRVDPLKNLDDQAAARKAVAEKKKRVNDSLGNESKRPRLIGNPLISTNSRAPRTVVALSHKGYTAYTALKKAYGGNKIEQPAYSEFLANLSPKDRAVLDEANRLRNITNDSETSKAPLEADNKPESATTVNVPANVQSSNGPTKNDSETTDISAVNPKADNESESATTVNAVADGQSSNERVAPNDFDDLDNVHGTTEGASSDYKAGASNLANIAGEDKLDR